MRKYTLYYLVDENKIPFYVGITSNLTTRLMRHKWEAMFENKHYNLPKNNKLRKVLNKTNLKMRDLVNIIEIDILNENIDEIEKYHIKKLKNDGIKLMNSTDGGRDAVAHDIKLQKKATKNRTGLKRSEETKNRISLASKGIKKTEKHRMALVRAWKTRPPHSEKTLNKMRKSMLGKNTSKYKLTDPNGKIYIIEGLMKFCIEHGLSHPNISKVASGHRLHHKGWKAEKILIS